MTHFTNYRNKLLGHMDRLVDLDSDVPSPPVNVEIDLTNRCQLACQGCHFAYTHSRGPFTILGARKHAVDTGDVMDEGLARSIITQLAASGVKSITFTGGGEPTLHPKIELLSAMINSRAMDLGMYTNAVHITPQMASTFGRTMCWTYVSLDAPDRETYRREKGTDAFERACIGAKNLSQHVDVVGIGFLLHAGNLDRVKEMAQLARRLGGSYVQFRPTIQYDHRKPNVPCEDLQWARNAADLEVPDAGIPVEFDRRRFLEYGEWRGHGYTECLWSGLQSVITPDGRVWTCCNKRGLETACLGDLNRELWSDIWSRRPIAKVNRQCRILCRGHLPNKFLHQIRMPRDHGNFI